MKLHDFIRLGRMASTWIGGAPARRILGAGGKPRTKSQLVVTIHPRLHPPEADGFLVRWVETVLPPVALVILKNQRHGKDYGKIFERD